MDLLPVDSVERLQRTRRVWERIDANNLKITKELLESQSKRKKCPDAEEDAFSDLSDPFSDMGNGDLARPFMDQEEGNHDMKNVCEHTEKIFKEPLGFSNYEYLIDLPQEQDEQLKQLLEDTLSTCRLPSPPPPAALAKQDGEGAKVRGASSPENRGIVTKSPLGEFNETNSLSEVWRLLEVQSTSNGFPVSPIGYNVFDDKRRSGWLQRESATWSEQEASRQKCEDWLKKL